MRFKLYADAYNFKIIYNTSNVLAGFHYLHTLAEPFVTPSFSAIESNGAFCVHAPAVLRFGMLEGSAIVNAEKCVYDPQSPDKPEHFAANGSVAKDLAIVGNIEEITRLAKIDDPDIAARSLLTDACSIVIVKGGASGLRLHTRDEEGIFVPAFQSPFVWTIGSGDIFSAVFCAQWAVIGLPPVDAARLASRAVAEYAATQTLPISHAEELWSVPFVEASQCNNSIYLAGPFFTIAQRLFIDSTRACLQDLGVEVFSPIHDVGLGTSAEVAIADLEAIDRCDAIFAVIDGLDAGTIFEIGYARAKRKPVYAFSQTVSAQDLTMLHGSGCRVYTDFVTAAYHMVWGT